LPSCFEYRCPSATHGRGPLAASRREAWETAVAIRSPAVREDAGVGRQPGKARARRDAVGS